MILSKSKCWKISLLSFVIFQLIFIFVFLHYYSVIVITSGKYFSYEYWEWWLSQSNPLYTRQVVHTVTGIAQISRVVFGAEVLILLWKNRKSRHIIKISVGLFLLTYCIFLGWRYYYTTQLLHYRLFMDLIPSEIVSMILLIILMIDTSHLDRPIDDTTERVDGVSAPPE